MGQRGDAVASEMLILQNKYLGDLWMLWRTLFSKDLAIAEETEGSHFSIPERPLKGVREGHGIFTGSSQPALMGSL